MPEKVEMAEMLMLIFDGMLVSIEKGDCSVSDIRRRLRDIKDEYECRKKEDGS